jgi:uncharacterized membrane protein
MKKKFEKAYYFISPLVVAAVMTLGLAGSLLDVMGCIALVVIGMYVGALLVDKDLVNSFIDRE